MKVNGKLYVPRTWSDLPRKLRCRFAHVDQALQAIPPGCQVGYRDLAGFKFEPPAQLRVRKGLQEALRGRSPHTYSMTQEIAAFNRALETGIYEVERPLYDIALRVRSLMFGRTERLRRFHMTISYHQWMTIAPPLPSDPVFQSISRWRAGPPLYCALALYLILLTAHPFSDGNGRTSRLLFNLQLAQGKRYSRYVPIAELTRSTNGVYEELIASACYHGDFVQLVWHLLDLFEAYALFTQHLAPPQEGSDIAEVLAIVSQPPLRSDLNRSPPYPLSVANLLRHQSDGQADRTFIASALVLANALEAFATVEFAMTSFADILASPSARKTRTITVFVTTTRKDDLQMRVREMRARLGEGLQLQVVARSDEAVRDARLLLALSARYASAPGQGFNCAVLLYDFPTNSVRDALHGDSLCARPKQPNADLPALR